MNRPVPSNCGYGPELPELVLVDFLEGPHEDRGVTHADLRCGGDVGNRVDVAKLTLTRPPPWPAHAGDEVANGATAMV